MRIVYSIQNVSNQLIDPIVTEVFRAKVDPTDNTRYCILMNRSNLLRGIESHPSCNIILEVQVTQANQDNDGWFIAFGWTIINLFDH
jgi:hypothetical protein